MQLVPYSNLKPKNLEVLLFVARLLAYLGYFFFSLSLVLFLAVIFDYFSLSDPVHVKGSLALSYQPSLFHGFIAGFLNIGLAFLMLIISSLCAALVSWEASLPNTNHKSTWQTIYYTHKNWKLKGITMFYFEAILFISFVYFSGFGYRKNKRNMMLLGSFCLFLSLSAEPFVKGFNTGFTERSQEIKQSKSAD